jgi:hypothetical protein
MSEGLGFDRQLPDLPLALDPAAAQRLFEERWRQEGRPLQARSSKRQDVKYQPGRRCVATYVLVADGPAGPEQTIGVVELTPAGLACRLYDEDSQLPWLREAANPALMAPRFAELLGGPVAGCAVTPIRYRAGSRCVFRYELEGPAGPQVIFGKLLREGAAELAATATALHRASLESPAMPQILPPLAFWPELQLVLQAEVAGRAELNDLAFDEGVPQPTRERWLHDAGARLAGLHGAAVAGPPRTLAEDLDELREYVAPMAAADPALAERYAAAVERAAGRAAALAEGPPVASHGAFRTDQFMIQGDHLVMIDLDGFCHASPARDIGNFLAYLRWKAIRQPQRAAMIGQAGQLFLEGYGAARPGLDAGALAVYEAASMLKVAGRRYRSLTAKEWHLTPALIDQAVDTLG